MNALAVKAGVLAALSFVLLVPTFNAINTSHFDAEPPFELDNPPTPPPDFVPPDGPLPDGGEGKVEPPPYSPPSCETYEHHFESAGWIDFESSGILGLGENRPRTEEFVIHSGGLALGPSVVFQNPSAPWQGTLRFSIDGPSGETQTYDKSADAPQAPPPPDSWTPPIGLPSPGSWTITMTEDPNVGSGSIAVVVDYPACKASEGAP